VTVPRWLLFLVAAWVIAFGVFRIVVALRPRSPEGPNFMRKGLYARAPRSHILFGAVYLMLGAFLIATGFGWAPVMEMGGCAGKRDSMEHPDSTRSAPAGDSAGGK
jgi:uncharacterized membrane protein HdeD (DUF308 family)